MLEVTFPTAVIFHVSDDTVHNIKSILSAMRSGEAHHEAGVKVAWWLTAGSKVEGLAMRNQWGHGYSDLDCMLLYGAQLGVCVPQEHPPTWQNYSSHTSPSSPSGFYGKSCLLYDPEGCPPAFTRLRITDCQAIMAHPYVDDSCILECDGQHWLLSTRLNEIVQRAYNNVIIHRMSPADKIIISGPAGQARRGHIDLVPALVANGPHPAIVHYINRLRNTEWPSQVQRKEIQQLPMKLVLVGHKDSLRKTQEFRISWSTGEYILISPLPLHIKQGYIAFKYVMKYFLKINRGQNETYDGRSKIGSYYFKSTLLYHLESTTPSKISSPFDLMIDLLINLKGYLKHRKLPHYFLPECDLLSTVGHEEQRIALKCIKDILSDPISAVLKCPAIPRQIYGDVIPDELVAVFKHASTHPCCVQRRDQLLVLLSRLDEWRQQHHRLQMELDASGDEESWVHCRPEMRRLVWNIIEQTTHM